MFQSDTAWTAWLYNVQCLKLEQDSSVTAHFKWINSVLRWRMIVMENNKISSRSSIRRILTICHTGATGIIHYFNLLKYIPTSCCTGPVAQSVQRLAMGWTVRGSNPGGGEIFRTRPGRPWGLPSLFCNGYQVFPGPRAAMAWRWQPTPI
jgi:hypothetical protein